MRSLALLVLAAVLGPAPGAAHDFWLVPSSYRSPVPGVIDVALRVGDVFPTGETYARNPTHVRRFVVVGPTGERAVPGRPGAEPAGRIGLDRAGTYVVGYWSRPTLVELSAERFATHARTEGLADAVLRLRPARRDPARPERELFARSAKAVVLAGAGEHAGHDLRLGLPLELIPERHPADLAAGDELTVRLLHDGAPMSDTPVVAMPGDLPGHRLWARTDGAGRARLRLDRAGVWLVRSIRIAVAPDPAVADWESLWASLTFEIATAPRRSDPAASHVPPTSHPVRKGEPR
jgi:hypothetical protein